MIVEFVAVWQAVIVGAVLWVAVPTGLAVTVVAGACVWLGARVTASRAQHAPRVHPAPERAAERRTDVRPQWVHRQALDYEETA